MLRRGPAVVLTACVLIVAPRPDGSIVLARSAALRPVAPTADTIADGGWSSLRPLNAGSATAVIGGDVGKLLINTRSITIGNAPGTPGDDTYFNAQDLANVLVFSSIEITGDNIDIAEDIDLSSSPYGQPSTDLILVANTINLVHNVQFGDGAVRLQAATVNLDGKVTSSGRLGSARLFGSATQINVLSNKGSIQQAIAFASRPTPFNPTAAAATIHVAGGQQYSGNLTIDKSLTLLGDPGDPSVAGAGAAAPTLMGTVADGTAISIAASDVTVSGFNLSAQVFGGWLDNSNDGIAGSGTNITIRDNTFTAFDINGVAMRASQNLDVTYNLFSNIGVNALDVLDSGAAITAPNAIVDTTAGTFAQVSSGFHHTCAVRSDRTLACWGDNTFGEATPPQAPSRLSTPATVHFRVPSTSTAIWHVGERIRTLNWRSPQARLRK
jgi:hypothetical protein